MRVGVRAGVMGGILALGLLAASPEPVLASGFAVENQGARAMGFAGAYVAQALDPSAIFYNAGGVGYLKGRQLYVSGGLGTYNTDFTGSGPFPPAGTLESTSRRLTVLPSIYYTHQVAETLTVGVGVNQPFGYRAEWENPDSFTGRTLCTDCEVRSWGVSPTIGWQVRDRLAIGFGLDVRFSSFRMSRRIQADPGVFTTPTDVAALHLESESDTGLGWNIGVLASPTHDLSVGLAYHSRVIGDFGATGTFTQIPTGSAAVDAAVALALPAAQPAIVTFDFPANFAAGLNVKHGDWTVEGDLVWTFWSAFDDINIRLPGAPVYSADLPMAYENTWQGRLGAEYLLNETWIVRAGYAYDHGPQPTTTVSPFLHDSNRHAFGGGATWKQGNFHLDLMARYLNFRHRDTMGTNRYGYDGVYQSSGFQLAAGLGWKF
jgi:long-chain fatty acid transport protein